jgi:hypothetical protein
VSTVVVLTGTGFGEAAKEDIVGLPAVEVTVRLVKDCAVNCLESVTVTLTVKVPEDDGVQLREAVLEDAHPGGRPVYA